MLARAAIRTWFLLAFHTIEAAARTFGTRRGVVAQPGACAMSARRDQVELLVVVLVLVFLVVLVVLALGEVVGKRRLTPLEQAGEQPAEQPERHVQQRERKEILQLPRQQQA